MSGLIEFCVELRSVGEAAASQMASAQEESVQGARGRRAGKVRRQNSVVCSRVHTLNTISYVDDGEWSDINQLNTVTEHVEGRSEC